MYSRVLSSKEALSHSHSARVSSARSDSAKRAPMSLYGLGVALTLNEFSVGWALMVANLG